MVPVVSVSCCYASRHFFTKRCFTVHTNVTFIRSQNRCGCSWTWNWHNRSTSKIFADFLELISITPTMIGAIHGDGPWSPETIRNLHLSLHVWWNIYKPLPKDRLAVERGNTTAQRKCRDRKIQSKIISFFLNKHATRGIYFDVDSCNTHLWVYVCNWMNEKHVYSQRTAWYFWGILVVSHFHAK